MQSPNKVQLSKIHLADRLSNGSDLTVGSDNSTSASQSNPNHFQCYLMTKNGSLSQYSLQVNSESVSIVSAAKGRVKAEIALNSAHIKQMPKQPRSNSGYSSTEDSSPHASQKPASTVFWYPVKYVMQDNRSRTVFLESRKLRNAVIKAVITAQGFANQLD